MKMCYKYDCKVCGSNVTRRFGEHTNGHNKERIENMDLKLKAEFVVRGTPHGIVGTEEEMQMANTMNIRYEPRH